MLLYSELNCPGPYEHPVLGISKKVLYTNLWM